MFSTGKKGTTPPLSGSTCSPAPVPASPNTSPCSPSTMSKPTARPEAN